MGGTGIQEAFDGPGIGKGCRSPQNGDAELFAMVLGENARWLANGYLIQTITGKPIYLGLAGLFTAVPNILFSFVGGAMADRVSRRKILLFTSSFGSALTFLVALLVFTDLIAVWQLLGIAFLLGTSFAFDAPARQALLPHLVAREDMASAVALNSAVWQTNRITGPVVAGLLIAFVGIGFSYVATAIGYGLAFIMIAQLRLPAVAVERRGSMLSSIREGLGFIRRSALFSGMIGLSFMTSIFGYSYVVLLPVFALDILDVGAIGFSLMETAAGIGAILGTLSIAFFKIVPRNGRTLIVGAVSFGLLLIAFSTSRTMPATLALLFAAGFFNALYLNLALTTLQLRVPDALRGRVMSVWNLTWVLTPLGGFVAGGVAQVSSAPVAVALGGAAVAGFAAAITAGVPAVRRIGLEEAPSAT